MEHNGLMGAIVLCLALLAAGCGGREFTGEEERAPATVYAIEGTERSRVVLTEQAAERLGVRTATARRNGDGIVIPYSAVLYSPTGETWAYVSRKPLTFVRRAIVVDRIEGERALLTSGPKPGTKVATVGVAELYGAESGLGQ